MGNLNKVFLICRLGSDPEQRVTASGKSVVNVSGATTEYFKDQSGNKNERTEWHRLQMWERTAEICAKFCKKGSQIFIEGSLQTREWQDKNENKRYTTEVIVRSVQLLDGKQDGGGTQGDSYQQPQAQSRPVQNSDDQIEDDIPF